MRTILEYNYNDLLLEIRSKNDEVFRYEDSHRLRLLKWRYNNEKNTPYFEEEKKKI